MDVNRNQENIHILPRMIHRLSKCERGGRGYVQIDNEIIRSPHLSLKARGLLSYALSFPPQTELTTKLILDDIPEGADALKSILSELSSFGHARVLTLRDKLGRVRTKIWEFHEFPINNNLHPRVDFHHDGENPRVENPSDGKSTHGDAYLSPKKYNISKNNNLSPRVDFHHDGKTHRMGFPPVENPSDGKSTSIYNVCFKTLREDKKEKNKSKKKTPPCIPPKGNPPTNKKSRKVLIPDEDSLEARGEILVQIMGSPTWESWREKNGVTCTFAELESEFDRFCNHFAGKMVTPGSGFRNWMTNSFAVWRKSSPVQKAEKYDVKDIVRRARNKFPELLGSNDEFGDDVVDTEAWEVE